MTENNTIPLAKRPTAVKIFLPAIVLVTSFYYSFLFTAGIIVGYALCRLFCHLFLHNGKIESIFIDYGKWQLHLHHWIMGVAILGLVWAVDFFYLPTFFAGFICGIIIQDIYDYNDWYKIIVKNPEYQKEATI
jgi:hypothetical protein